MKEIGEKLKSARESMEISIEEACSDLKIKESELNYIEEGKIEQFKDIYYLKGLIRDYAKYLGLNKDDIIDDFNEFLFDFTSKITLEDFKEEKKEDNRIKSPYTQIPSKNYRKKIIVVLSVLVLVSLIILIFLIIQRNNTPNVIGSI